MAFDKLKDKLRKFCTVDIKEMWLFFKVKLGYAVSTFAITVIFVDIVKMSYWKFTLISLPFDFIIGYWLNKYVFQRKNDEKRRRRKAVRRTW